MSESIIHRCQCSACLQTGKPLEKSLHARMNLLLSRLDEQQRRWYGAHEKEGAGGNDAKSSGRLTSPVVRLPASATSTVET